MRYATWQFAEIDGVRTTPLLADGVTFLDNAETIIIGYLNDDADMSMAEIYTIRELTQSQALELLKEKDNTVTLDSQGRFVFAAPASLGMK